jgi:small GTP-binding protein
MLKKKICMVGQFGVGKTSLVRRFVHSIYSERYLSTVGVQIDRKDVTCGSQPVTLILWDLAGEDDLAQLNLTHLRGASGYVLVADGLQSASLDKAIDLQGRIAKALGPLPFVVALNKADLREQWEIDGANVEERGWRAFVTSAKSGAGVEEMFQWLAGRLAGDGAAAQDPIA